MILKRGQVAIFVILAIVIIGGIIAYLVFREKISTGKKIPQELAPVFDYYQSCIDTETRNAIDLVGTQGGRIVEVVYAPGSEYAPFSSHLNFLGVPVPYWYYVSGNVIIREKIPTIQEMQKDIEDY